MMVAVGLLFVDKRQALLFTFALLSPLLTPYSPLLYIFLPISFVLRVPNDGSIHNTHTHTRQTKKNRNNMKQKQHELFVSRTSTIFMPNQAEHVRAKGKREFYSVWLGVEMLSHKLCQDKNAHSSA